jgi:hypothetical protein
MIKKMFGEKKKKKHSLDARLSLRTAYPHHNQGDSEPADTNKLSCVPEPHSWE